ncbi:hypothetical protein MNBD_GAMMA11-1833 [hydrothermal vent metagenome]|uniref:Uncharacterized protein n=1 Tax=hydrothermal vent metagenome TaxID=652676 RepID=A0A3B0WW66_9ZZZZ
MEGLIAAGMQVLNGLVFTTKHMSSEKYIGNISPNESAEKDTHNSKSSAVWMRMSSLQECTYGVFLMMGILSICPGSMYKVKGISGVSLKKNTEIKLLPAKPRVYIIIN